jgi:hypothetical protein
VEAQRDMGLKKADWLTVLEDHVNVTKQIYETNDARFKAARIPIQDLKEAEYYYLEAQIWLERAKAQ